MRPATSRPSALGRPSTTGGYLGGGRRAILHRPERSGAVGLIGRSRSRALKRLFRGDPRVVAAIAIFLAIAAIALEVVYTIGRFAMDTVQQIP